MGKIQLSENQFNDFILNIVKESVEHFLDKWEYDNHDAGQQRLMNNYDGEAIDEMDSTIERYGWEIAPIMKTVVRNGKEYTAYICIPKEGAQRIGDWAYVAGDLNMIANKYGMVVEHGRYKGIVTNTPEMEEKPKKVKRGMEPEATADKSGAHFFIIKPRSESNF